MAADSKISCVTVFGGSGFLGSEIVRRLAAAGMNARVAVRHPGKVRAQDRAEKSAKSCRYMQTFAMRLQWPLPSTKLTQLSMQSASISSAVQRRSRLYMNLQITNQLRIERRAFSREVARRLPCSCFRHWRGSIFRFDLCAVSRQGRTAGHGRLFAGHDPSAEHHVRTRRQLPQCFSQAGWPFSRAAAVWARRHKAPARVCRRRCRGRSQSLERSFVMT